MIKRKKAVHFSISPLKQRSFCIENHILWHSPLLKLGAAGAMASLYLAAIDDSSQLGSVVRCLGADFGMSWCDGCP